MTTIWQQIDESLAAIRSRWDITPRSGVILGSGLGGLTADLETHCEIPYEEIPHFPCVTAIGHRGRLLCGTIGDVPTVMMDGRCHRYEGHSFSEITLPVYVMHRLGIELLVVSNASGGLNPNFASGDVMLIEDHINLMWGSPLRGPNDESRGPRFPDMSVPYDPAWREVARRVARANDFVLHEGVYVAMAGPCYETRAEYRFLRRIGADVVGMSTVPEAIVAAYLKLPVLALSAVTNVCRPDVLQTTSAEAVLAAASLTESKMRLLVAGAVAHLAARPRHPR